MIGKSGAHTARTSEFEIIDQDGDIERRMDAHHKMNMISLPTEFDQLTAPIRENRSKGV